MFSKNLRAVYLYAVCFITLMMVIGGVIATVYSFSEYVAFGANDVGRLRETLNTASIWVISAPIFGFHWWWILKLEKKETTAENKEEEVPSDVVGID